MRETGNYLLMIQQRDVNDQEKARADQVAMTPAAKMEAALATFAATWVRENLAIFIARSATSSSSNSSLFLLRLFR